MFKELDEKMKHDWKLCWYYRKEKVKLDISEFYHKIKKYLHILKLRIFEWFSFEISFRLFRELTSNERGELARWITRNVTESTAETLRHVRGGFYGDEN